MVLSCQSDQHEHVAGADIFRRHALDFGGLPLPERRDDLGSDGNYS